MNKLLTVSLKQQLKQAAMYSGRSIKEELRARLEQTFGRDANPQALLSRMMMEQWQLDALITHLGQEQLMLPVCSPFPHWRPPHWLEATLSPGLVNGEYEAVISALSARRADLRRTYLPLMNALTTGNPVSPAVMAVLGV